jgi:hypothetical protein
MGAIDMSDPAAPGGLPAYWGKCEEMSYARLRWFIEHALEMLSSSSAPAEGELPSTEEEFLALCGMLIAKAEALKEGAPPPIPNRPKYVGPRNPGWEFAPSSELASLYSKRKRAERRVDDAYRDYESEVVTEWVERELEEVEREIAPLERREQEEYYKQRREYREARNDYESRIHIWEEEKRENSQEAEAERDRTARLMYRKVKRAFEPGTAVPTREVGWRFLPPGEVSDEDLLRHYDYRQRRNPLVRYDLDRIRKALSLGPNGRWVEREKFGDYIVFTYPFTSSALMECPIVGNAIYVLHSDPERWSGTPKQELIAEADRGGEVTRILHQGGWFERVKKELGAG